MKRRDYLLSMEVNDIIYPDEAYYGTLREAKRKGKALFRKELKEGGRLIIKVGGDENDKDYGEIVAERIYDVWLDYTDE